MQRLGSHRIFRMKWTTALLMDSSHKLLFMYARFIVIYCKTEEKKKIPKCTGPFAFNFPHFTAVHFSSQMKAKKKENGSVLRYWHRDLSCPFHRYRINSHFPATHFRHHTSKKKYQLNFFFPMTRYQCYIV